MIPTKILSERQGRIADALQLTDEMLLVGAGEPVPLPAGTDQTYPFRAHTEYFYLTGLDSPGGVIAFDPKDPASKRWVSFVPDVTEAERTWEGREQTAGETLAALDAWLTSRRGRTIINLGAPLRGMRPDEAGIGHAREQFSHARRPKDKTELQL